MHKSRYRPVLKLLIVVTTTELLIMSGLHLYTEDATPWLLDILDVVLLGLITTIVAQFWIVRPLAKAREQDALFRAITEDSHAGMVITNPALDHAIVYANPAFSRMTGYTMAEVEGQHPRFLFEGLGHQPELDKIAHALKAEEPVQALLQNSRKNGTVFWNDLHLSPIHFEGDSPKLWLALLEDVSESKALNLQVERLVSAVEQAGEMICIFDQQGRIDFVNHAFTKQVGLSAVELNGQSIWNYWCDESCMQQLVLAGLEQHGQWKGRNQWRREKNGYYEALTHISVVESDDKQRMCIAVIRDMTKEIEMENQLVHAQKMEAIGTLAGGIAHDFNNMLAAMMGNLYLLKKNVRGDSRTVHRIESIEEQGHRGADLIRQMLVFARKNTVDRQDFDLQLLGKETIKLLETSIPESLRLNTDIDAVGMIVHGDPSLLQSSLFNLVNNARDAIGNVQGRAGDSLINLSIHAVAIEGVAEEARQALTAQGNAEVRQCVHISVSDNGVGMDKATQARVFDPYFTTKEIGKGTGLGLPMVMGCVEMHGGWLGLESSPGKGTNIDIYLPIIDSSVALHVPHETSMFRGNGELILLADDNIALCESVCEILIDAGYRVITANDGEQALQQFMEHKADLRMAILDCVMPKIGGVEVAKTIWQHSGNTVKTVLMTGYDLDDSLPSEWECGEHPILLQKPWQLEQLNVALKSMGQSVN